MFTKNSLYVSYWVSKLIVGKGVINVNVVERKRVVAQPRLTLTEAQLSKLLKQNYSLIQGSRQVLKKVFEQLLAKEKFICLTDKNGCMIDLIADIETVQFLFENGLKLGTNVGHGGVTAVGKVLKSKQMEVVNGPEHSWEALQSWTCIAAPVYFMEEFKGVVSISLKIDEKINHCKIVVQLVSDYVAALLRMDRKLKPDRLTFFGALILDNQKGLTPREIEVLYHLKSGESINQLPDHLRVSPNTVKSHLKSIYRKLDVNSLEHCLFVIDRMIEQATQLNIECMEKG